MRQSWLCWGLLACAPAWAMELAALPDDLTELSLDDLLQVEVTSVSKQAEPLQEAAAAIFVVTGAEIRNAGARSIAEALRLVPGMHVARNAANEYAISARGFNSTTADKLEVLLDGRSVYTPLFSGVFWDVLDTNLGDIDRIEVIRGPGATLWGANAVNGVINIVTRKAQDSLGSELNLSGGTELRAAGSLRSGAAVGEAGAMRIYAKGFELDDSAQPDGSQSRDGQEMAQAGFRGDFGWQNNAALTISGDAYDGRVRDVGALSGEPTDTDVRGANVLAKLSWRSDQGTDLSLQAYVDQYQRDVPEIYSERRRTNDVQLQARRSFGRHSLVAGAGYRRTRDDTGGPPLLIVFEPANRSDETLSLFLQDQISFMDGRLVWTLGSKFERNDYTGDEVQPGTRLGFRISEQLFTWAAVSKAVRTPNRLDHDTALFCDPVFLAPLLNCTPNTIVPFGSPSFDAETLNAYEWGWRYTDGKRYSLDLALFFNDYDDLRTNEGAFPNASQANNASAEAYGAELSGTWKISQRWQARGFVSALELDAQPGDTTDATVDERDDTDPSLQAGLRLAWNPAEHWFLHSSWRYVGGFDQFSGNAPAPRVRSRVPAYTELNLRLAWQPTPTLELAAIGENLLDAQHPEFGTASNRVELERSARLELIWKW